MRFNPSDISLLVIDGLFEQHEASGFARDRILVRYSFSLSHTIM